MRFLSFTHAGRPGWGVEVEGGVIDLSARKRALFPTLREVIENDRFIKLQEFAAGLPVDFRAGEFSYTIPVPAPEKIICVGVNFPDRNAEYKDGQEAPPNPSLFVRFPRSFTGHEQPLIRPPESHQLDYEGEVTL
ncbi:MAG: fumarylacetoacetate hydrolase family protein, partial [Rhodobacteraceae bacterium]|nr:fumarylacetoacetate hydrolase family protein [Paracoccaceae bacterium]